MYSKCIVSPLIRTPMAIMASNGLAGADVGGCGDALLMSAVEEESRSVALIPSPEDEF
jgi:hypothetical protein